MIERFFKRVSKKCGSAFASLFPQRTYQLIYNRQRDVFDNSVPVNDLDIEEFLCREPLTVKDVNTAAYYAYKVVLVTGGGGSIGSELCRQIAECNPKKLIILDIYENNAYNIQQELIHKYGSSGGDCTPPVFLI